MSFAYIGVLLVMAVLIGFVSLAILWLARTVSNSIHRRTMDLISDYDDLFDLRSREIAVMERRLARPVETTAKVDQTMATVVEKEVAPPFLMGVAERISTTQYRDNTTPLVYRQIRDSFSQSPEEILATLPNGGAGGTGGIATRLLKELNYETVFALATMSGADQYQLMETSLDEEAKPLLSAYGKEGSRFQVLDFYSFLQDLADREPRSTVLHVPVGTKVETVPPNCVVEEDGEICEGFQVELGAMLYDYCIKAREIG
ncbi:MAG: hypothetical protein R3Y62_08475 [Eubacteriales bacterium]